MKDLDIILKYQLAEILSPIVKMDIADYLKKNKVNKIDLRNSVNLESQKIKILEISKNDIKVKHSNGKLEKIKLEELSIEILLAIKLLIEKNII